MGMMGFNSRLAVVVFFLTIVVAVAGWHIVRESGAPRINAFADEAVGAFISKRPEIAPTAYPDLAEAQKRVIDFSGAAIRFPRDDAGFVVTAIERRTITKRPALEVRFSYEGENYLLMIFRKEKFMGRKPLATFPDESLLSGERNGLSFVFWERDNASFIVVSSAEETQVFKLVRNFFN